MDQASIAHDDFRKLNMSGSDLTLRERNKNIQITIIHKVLMIFNLWMKEMVQMVVSVSK